MRVVVVRHHEEDDPGFVAEAFAAHDADLSVHRYPGGGPLPDPADVDHAVVLGAAWSVYDHQRVGAWIGDEMAWLRAVGTHRAGVLGICFGAQVLAAAYGGSVEPAGTMEIGWTAVDPVSAADGAAPSLPVPACAVAPGPWMEFHGDRCVLPASATVLARNELCVQAFTVGRCLGVQFHPEVDGAQLGRWLDHGSRDTVHALGLDPEELMERTRLEEPHARRRAARLVDAYLEACGS